MDQSGTGHIPVRGDLNAGLLLSLYLLLLAFFIVLYSISHREQMRSVAAIDSLTATFQIEGTKVLDVHQRAAVTVPFDSLATVKRELRRVFEQEVPIANVHIFQRGEIMHVTVPVAAIFVPGTAGLRLAPPTFLDALAGALKRRSGDATLEVRFVVGSGRSFPRAGAPPGLPLRRSVELAGALDGRALPGISVAAGVSVGYGGVVQILFVEPEPDDPATTGAGGAG
jgi:hypothetical protein